MQHTPKGTPIPTPTRGEFDANLAKASQGAEAAPEGVKPSGGRQAPGVGGTSPASDAVEMVVSQRTSRW
jgi:hypothetical protein